MNVSVIIPACNAERTLRRAIDSILHQTVPAAEIILIDDGSIDGTGRVARQYGGALRYFSYENAGLAVARNRGLDQAQAEWIGFLDADDEWLPGFVAAHQALMQRHNDLKWTYCPCERVLQDDRRKRSVPPVVQEEIDATGSVAYFRAMRAGFTFGVCGFMIRRSVFAEVGGFDPPMRNGADGDMWRRIALRYPRLAVCRDVGWRYYCDNPGSLHHQGRWCRDLQMKSLCTNMRRAMELAPEVANEYGLYARMLVMRDLMRQAARDCAISPDIVAEAKLLFPLGIRERQLLRILSWLPRSVAVRLVDRLVVS